MGDVINLDEYRIKQQNEEAASQDVIIDSEGNVLPRPFNQLFYQDISKETLDNEIIDTRDKLDNLVTQLRTLGGSMMGNYLDVLLTISHEDYITISYDTYINLVDMGLKESDVPEFVMQNGIRMIKMNRENIKAFRSTFGE